MHDLGDTVPLTVQVRDASGALTAPGTAVWTVTLPDGTTVTPPLSSPSVGVYAADYVPPMAGRYVARFVSTNPSAAFVDEFDVAPAVPFGIVSLSAAKAALNMSADSTTDDEELRSMIEAVTQVIESHRNEVIARRTVTEQIASGRTWRLMLGKTPVISLTSIVRPSDGTTWAPPDAVVVDADIGMVASYTVPFTGDLVATYVAGYQVVPANIVEAAKIIVRHLWQTQQTPNLGPRPFGGEDVGLTPSGLGFAIPNRAVELLGGRPPMIA